ncbi:MAG: dihydrodipicolinate synthase family protein, partial [Spirochaetota bacterium]
MMHFDKSRLSGPTVALYSCFDATDNVDEAALGRLVAFYIDKGVKGLYVCGSTGEGLLMSNEERMKTLEAVAAASGGRLSLVVHVGANATRDSIILARHAAANGAMAVSAIPSVYYRYPESSIERHWASIMEASELPFIIYNIPQLCGYDMTPALFRRMLGYEKVVGIKNSAMSVQQTAWFKAEGGPEFTVFNGPDEQYLAGRAMGADGGIGGT